MPDTRSDLLSEHWYVYPLGNATPDGGRGKRFALTDHEGVRRCHRDAVAAGHHPFVRHVSRYQSPGARTPQRYASIVHLTRVGDSWSTLPGEWSDPYGWQAMIRIEVTLSSAVLSRDGVAAAAARLRVWNKLQLQLRFRDIEVVVAIGDGGTHTSRCTLDDGTVLTEADEQVRDQVLSLVAERLRWNDDAWNETTMVEDYRKSRAEFAETVRQVRAARSTA